MAGTVLFGFRISEILEQVAVVPGAKIEVAMPRIHVGLHACMHASSI